MKTVEGVAVMTDPFLQQFEKRRVELEARMLRMPTSSQIIQRWGVSFLPTTLIFDAHLRIRLRGQGAIDWDAAAIDRQLQPLFK